MKRFAAFCFSLLVNSTDLESSIEVFKLMCIVFLNQSYSSNVHEAKSNLQKLIAKRPDNGFEIEKIIDENSREETQTEDSVVGEVIDEPKCE
jgi:hypothetical protein